jgi:hypothetical protein
MHRAIITVQKMARRKSIRRKSLYIRASIPILHKPNYAVVIGPHYRTEQLEFKHTGDNPMDRMGNWQLRSMGIDMKSFLRLNRNSYLVIASNVTKSGNLTSVPLRHVPVNYNFASVYMKKRWDRNEIGLGLLVSRAHNLTILPVFVLNHNFRSEKSGIEIALPKKISWRYNLAPSDIFYLKSEAVTKKLLYLPRQQITFLIPPDRPGYGLFLQQTDQQIRRCRGFLQSTE